MSGDSPAHNVFAAVHTDLLHHHADSDRVVQDASADTDDVAAESVPASTSPQTSLGRQWQHRYVPSCYCHHDLDLRRARESIFGRYFDNRFCVKQNEQQTNN